MFCTEVELKTTTFSSKHYFGINPKKDPANQCKHSDFELKQFKTVQQIRNVIKVETAEIS